MVKLRWTLAAVSVFLLSYSLGIVREVYLPGSYTLRFPFERDFPLIPQALYPYFSINFLFFVALFMIPEKRIPSVAKKIIVACLIAGVTFLVFPTRRDFRVHEDLVQSWQVQFIRSIDVSHNLFPSLHVAFTVILGFEISSVMGNSFNCWKFLLVLWCLAIIFATVLLHQHHIPDVVGGLFLGLVSLRFFSQTHAAEPIKRDRRIQESSMEQS